jgi:hypothetical protein
MRASKTLPKQTTTEEIQALSMDQATPYKNKFLGHEQEGDTLKLTFFLNPYQSFTRHEPVATRKFQELYKQGTFFCSKASLTDIDRSKNHLHTYIYKLS